MWTLGVDAVTAEITDALVAARVASLLLKGPSLAQWLYANGPPRSYGDTDVLVAPGAVPAACVVLEAAGFRRAFGPLPHGGMERPPSYPWVRGRAVVDLHEALPGAQADPTSVFEILDAGAETLSVGGTQTRALGLPARLAHVAAHAAHHGPAIEQPLRDLERALALAGDDEWVAARDLAQRIGSTVAFSTGLGLLPAGRGVGARLGLDVAPPLMWLLEKGPVPMAAGLERLSSTPGLRPKARLLRDEIAPSPAFMRWWTPLARRSRRGLAVAYLVRAASMTVGVLPALSAWGRARRGARR